MRQPLPYKVECRNARPYYEAIAAFDCESAATAYASECALRNPKLDYRVKRGHTILKLFGPEA